MYDVVHASIARQRVQELVETAAVQRAVRAPRPAVAAEATPPAPAAPHAGRRVALRRLRPRLR
jgi:hypothetical protein